MSDKKAEPAVYRQLSADMRQGLKDIYQQISTASQSKPLTDADTDALFHEATAQLAEVLKATESATMSIMEVVERHLDLQAQNTELKQIFSQLGAVPVVRANFEWNYITRKVADRLQELFTTMRADYEQKWDDLKIFIEYGIITDEKFAAAIKAANAYGHTL